MIIVTSSFWKCFPIILKRKAGISNFSGRKVPFGDGLVWTVSLTVKIRLRFQISPAD